MRSDRHLHYQCRPRRLALLRNGYQLVLTSFEQDPDSTQITVAAQNCSSQWRGTIRSANIHISRERKKHFDDVGIASHRRIQQRRVPFV